MTRHKSSSSIALTEHVLGLVVKTRQRQALEEQSVTGAMFVDSKRSTSDAIQNIL